MTRRFLADVQYIDALPTGAYAAMVPEQTIRTHAGDVALPPGETWGLHYLRCSNVGGFHFGGQAHTRPSGAPPLLWEWKAGQWSSRTVPTGRGAYDSKGVFRDGLPNGIQYVEEGTDRPVSRIDTYNDAINGLSEWTKLAGLEFGQGNGTPDGGVIVFDGTHKRILFDPPQHAYFVNVNRAGDNVAVSFVGDDGAWIVQSTLDELRTLQVWTPPAQSPVAFSFTHPVIVAPFKDPSGVSGARYRIDSGELGLYTEEPDPSAVIASAPNTRVFVAHDSIAPWGPPSSLRSFDVPLLEFYRVPSETLSYSVARWKAQLSTLLAMWRGDVGVVPMFYCQGGSPPAELWAVSDVLDGLRHLSDLVNLSPRVKVIAPFAYDRANGITAHPELRAAFAALLAAATKAGEATLRPVPSPTQPIPDPVPVPQPTEPSMPDLTPDQKNEVCDAIGAVAAAAFGKDPASMSQGVRQAIDQDVTAISDLMLLAQAREGGASPQAVERAAAAGRLLQGR